MAMSRSKSHTVRMSAVCRSCAAEDWGRTVESALLAGRRDLSVRNSSMLKRVHSGLT